MKYISSKKQKKKVSEFGVCMVHVNNKHKIPDIKIFYVFVTLTWKGLVQFVIDLFSWNFISSQQILQNFPPVIILNLWSKKLQLLGNTPLLRCFYHILCNQGKVCSWYRMIYMIIVHWNITSTRYERIVCLCFVQKWTDLHADATLTYARTCVCHCYKVVGLEYRFHCAVILNEYTIITQYGIQVYQHVEINSSINHSITKYM